MCAIEEWSIATDDVHVVSADTDTTPMDPGAIASRTTYVTGNAVRLAAEKGKAILFEVAAPLLGVKPNQLEAKDHKIQVKGFPQRNLHIGDVADHARGVNGQPPIGSATFNPATVALDPETGPFGAKGVGEPTCVSTAAAILNAIHDAVGVRITSLPATAEKVYTAIKAKRAQEARLITAGEPLSA